jgi:hypothetical protein
MLSSALLLVGVALLLCLGRYRQFPAVPTAELIAATEGTADTLPA